MEKGFLAPKKVAIEMINVGVKKADLKMTPMILLGILAGIFIGFGSIASIIISQTLGNLDPGISKFAGALVFPVGLMLVVIAGAELFTGNNLMTLALMNKKITMGKMFRNWSTVWIANFIGSIILAIVVYYSGILEGDAAIKAISIAEAKVSLDIMSLILRGTLCNIMVVLAVWMSTSCQDIISKIFSCWFPIMLFVLCGFEHSVANMFFIPMAQLLGANITIGQLFYNLIFVTIGNIIGGAIIIPFMYQQAYLAETERDVRVLSEAGAIEEKE